MLVRNKLLVTGSIVIGAAVFVSWLFHSGRSQANLDVLPTPIRLEVDKPSISVNELTKIKVRAVSNNDNEEELFQLVLPDMRIDKQVTLKELTKGVFCQAKPESTGLFELALMQGKVRRGGCRIVCNRKCGWKTGTAREQHVCSNIRSAKESAGRKSKLRRWTYAWRFR
jgi:hypothetical protein